MAAPTDRYRIVVVNNMPAKKKGAATGGTTTSGPGGGGSTGGRVTPPALGSSSGPVSADPTLPDQVARMPYDDLVSRRDLIKARLEVISIDVPKGGGGGGDGGMV